MGMSAMAFFPFSWRRALAAPASQTFTLANDQLTANWQMKEGLLTLTTLPGLGMPAPVFVIELGDGTTLSSDTLTASHATQKKRTVHAQWDIPQQTLRIEWVATLGPQDHFVRQHLTLSTTGRNDSAIAKIILFKGTLHGAHPSGTLAGCPLITDTAFYAIEHPMAQHEVDVQSNVVCYLARTLPLKAGQSITISTVTGIAKKGQLRRAFLAYLEAARPRKTSPMLHYNCWYDLSYSNIRYDEAGILSTIAAWQEKWTKTRGKKLHSFLLDDGWDNTHELWKLNAGFPQGFSRVVQALSGIGAKLGLWLSPWGGYGDEKPQRIASATALGMEQHASGLALSGRNYFAYFLDVTSRLLRFYGINQFKFDGMGAPDAVAQNSAFDSDFDAAIALIGQLRHLDPKLYINLTVGTYASPFWLLYADSIWRGGADHGFTGVGSKRQQWLTFRDAQTYANVVLSSSLFPLSSLMLHGIILARHCPELNTSSETDFVAEVQSFFATGTQCQELYLSHDLLSDTMWDTLAHGAVFAQQHADVLADSHWVGGDPAKLEVYGWGAWKENTALLTLRNPSDKPQTFLLRMREHLELPEHANGSFFVSQPFSSVQPLVPEQWLEAATREITLAPFEVKTWWLQ